MLIVLNDEEIEYTGEASILELLRHMGYDRNSVAIAIDGEFLPEAQVGRAGAPIRTIYRIHCSNAGRLTCGR